VRPGRAGRLVALLCAAWWSHGLHAQQATVQPDGQFRWALSLGASASDGNSRASSLALGGEGVQATDGWKTTVRGSGLYTRSGGVATGERLRLGVRHDRQIDARWFGFGGLDAERDKFANVALRAQASGGLGLHVVRTDTSTWDVFGGLGLNQDRFVAPALVDGQVRSRYRYTSALLAQEGAHKFTPTTSAKQRLVLYPNLRNRGEYRATWDASLSVAMSSTLSLNVGLGVTHNSDPGPGRRRTDSLLTTGVAMRFD
jgi:putative salt-induced outer membrane protein YdiY